MKGKKLIFYTELCKCTDNFMGKEFTAEDLAGKYFFLEDRCVHSGFGKSDRCRRTRRSAADNDRVKMSVDRESCL